MFPANSRRAAGGECGQGGGARQRQQQQPALHQGRGGDWGCYTDTSALTILGTHIKHVSADWYSMYFTWQF